MRRDPSGDGGRALEPQGQRRHRREQLGHAECDQDHDDLVGARHPSEHEAVGEDPSHDGSDQRHDDRGPHRHDVIGQKRVQGESHEPDGPVAEVHDTGRAVDQDQAEREQPEHGALRQPRHGDLEIRRRSDHDFRNAR